MANRGRPFESGNKFGRGRPPGSRNKKSLAAQQLLDSHADSVIRKSLVKALNGDSPLLRTLLGYILPRRREVPVNIAALPVHTADDLVQTSEAIFRKIASGQLTLQQARDLLMLIELRRGVIETRELEERLRALESETIKSATT